MAENYLNERASAALRLLGHGCNLCDPTVPACKPLVVRQCQSLGRKQKQLDVANWLTGIVNGDCRCGRGMGMGMCRRKLKRVG